ncbi:MAG: hypothetical protein A2931_00585 [Candidatus Niyogibacteria bacterium RIFCSPLOWO2_01_FULL_45_48]|uniref:Methyltransferase domain-containing protein n=2 Tax=Candidatus Niyogiibacteriota TaxID=1817912 RepID=A0A1G2F0R7_9BACT|nr:MAG: hypothetical protein A2931_00585 [Candidatus Niyogibacteria bacterium RIFCSPLOWO2_01_FULL_45_48]OGZ30041.1 MAG: hypothetical protein A2835_03445 [Candidatus Niyogibacteria bacterium RIFCSPHIGHO2_01_FULL_45_28]OGZ31619.1 MAG: hypothetical protein A3J00_00195 [Candidatus Niyogibacteria bacterium RIFCSPLOWO2_02_FULL_45_13]
MNEITKFGARYYGPGYTWSAYRELQNEYNNFALKETGKPWWEEFAKRLRRGHKVLDLGCGSGVPARFLSGHGLRVVGVDVSGDMVTLARKQDPQGVFFRAEMDEIRWPMYSFGGVCSFFSFLHLPKRRVKKLIRDIHEWLLPGGVFAVTIVEGEGEGLCENFMGRGIPIYLSYYKQPEFCDMLRVAGFTVKDTKRLEVKTDNFDETELFFLASKTGTLGE